MGEICEDMVEGRMCQICGMYFSGEKNDAIHEHRYPVVCWECWKTLTKEERKLQAEIYGKH